MGYQSIYNQIQVNLDEFYTNCNLHEHLLARAHMRLQVEEHWKKLGNPMPESVTSLPLMAVRERHVATARREDYVFARTAGILGLQPVWSEYSEDIYVQASTPKSSLLKIPLTEGGTLKVADPDKWGGKKLSSITTQAGTNLLDFHHRLWNLIPGENIRLDCSTWLQRFGSAGDYYVPALSLFVAHGVLFNDFHGQVNPLSSKKSGEFTRAIVEPACREVEGIFGHKPLIFRFSYQSGFETYPHIVYDPRKDQGHG